VKFKGKVAIVTGGAQGIGGAYARLLAEEGARVIIADVNVERGRALARDITAAGGSVVATATDVSSPEACRACVDEAVRSFGGVDYLVNNAGLLSSYRLPPLHLVPVEDYLRLFSVNTHGVLFMTQAVVPSMLARGGGAIVNTSSVASWMADGAYAVSKLAVNGLTAALARALAPQGIRVNAVAPGPVDTDGLRDLGVSVESLHEWAKANGKPTNSVAAPIDIAKLGVFLLSDEARFISGQIVAADGATIVRQ